MRLRASRPSFNATSALTIPSSGRAYGTPLKSNVGRHALLTMPSSVTRYSNLAPLSLDQRVQLSIAALTFFSPMQYGAMCQILGRPPETGKVSPFTGRDFTTYLKHIKLLDEPDRYVYRLRELLAKLERVGILMEVGRGGDIFFGAHYYAMLELTTRQREGIGWLAGALGPEFLYWMYSSITMQVTGTNSVGDIVAGTALVIAPNRVLTCAHVLNDMSLDKSQTFKEQQFTVLRAVSHPTIDVGVIEFSPSLPLLPGLAFRDPIVAEPVFTLGFPRVPLSRQPALVMQRGEVTTPAVTLLDGSEVFLYSAVARPGNSGGPILSETGHVVGIVTEELSEKSNDFRMPFHAGVQTTVLIRALAEIDSSFTLPLEHYQ